MVSEEHDWCSEIEEDDYGLRTNNKLWNYG